MTATLLQINCQGDRPFKLKTLNVLKLPEMCSLRSKLIQHVKQGWWSNTLTETAWVERQKLERNESQGKAF